MSDFGFDGDGFGGGGGIYGFDWGGDGHVDAWDDAMSDHEIRSWEKGDSEAAQRHRQYAQEEAMSKFIWMIIRWAVFIGLCMWNYLAGGAVIFLYFYFRYFLHMF